MKRSTLLIPTLIFVSVLFIPQVNGIIVPDSTNETGYDTSGNIPRNVSSLMGFDDLYESGYTGDGIKIAVLDTGINGNHSDLRHGLGTTTSLITVNKSFVPSEGYGDNDGHGTFIAGMIIGNGDASNGDIVGLAPEAEVWNLKVLDSNGEGESDWIENALEWILGLSSKPDIISISLGSMTPLPEIENLIYQLWDAGVMTVIAAGNEGPEYYTINSPGTVLDAITVGACTTDEYLLSFSSEGPSMIDGYYKPDLVAFGVDIVSLAINSGYSQEHGTSFAVPFISAGIALLMDATDGAYTPDEIKAAILESCHSIGYLHYMEGAGLPNFSLALELLENSSWDGFALLPSEIEFPIESKEGNTTVDEYKMKVTVINSRLDDELTVNVLGDISDFTTVTMERYEGGTDQFAVSITIQENSPSFGSGSGTINIRDSIGTVVATISVTVTVTGETSPLFPLIIIATVLAFLIGILAFFAIAYRKGSKTMPYNQCELKGICPSSS